MSNYNFNPEEGDIVFEELLSSIRKQPVRAGAKRLATTPSVQSAIKDDVVLVGNHKVTALKKGLPDDDNEALMNCTYLAQYYASLDARRGEQRWTARYCYCLQHAGWKRQKEVEFRKGDVKSSPSIPEVTSMMVDRVGHGELAEFMEFKLWKIGKDEKAMGLLLSSGPGQSGSFQMTPVEKPSGQCSALVVTMIDISMEERWSGGDLSFFLDLFRSSKMQKIGGYASSHVLDENHYQFRQPTIQQCLEELATTGYSDISANFNKPFL